MGGFSGPVAEFATKAFARLGEHFEGSEAGKMLKDTLANDYIPKLHQIHETLVKGEMAKPINVQRAPGEVMSEAKAIARTHALGQNDALGAAIIKSVEKQPGFTPLQIVAEKQKLADATHMFLRDTQEDGGGKYSRFKKNVRYNKENPSEIKVGAHYTPPTEFERKAMSFTSRIMLPAIAIPHIGTLFNYALNTPLQDLAKGTADAIFNNRNVKQFASDFGIFNGTLTDAWTVRHLGAKGLIATATSNPEFGKIVNSITHQPGFNALREFTISIGAASGKHTLERMANQFVKSNGTDKFALYQLKKMGVDTSELMARGGQITPDMMRKAIFHFVDNNVFLDNTLQRSYYSGASAFNRLGGMYHGYISRQGRLLRDTVVDNINNSVRRNRSAQGLAQAAQAFATLGIVFPVVGTGLKTLQMYGRGQFQEASPLEDFKTLSGSKGIKPALIQAIDGYAHMAAFGVATEYIRGGLRHQMAQQLIGPIGNEVVNLAQDSLAATLNPKHPISPLGRDVLEDTLPDNLGKIIAHQLLPTSTETKKRHPKTSLKMSNKSFSIKKLKGVN